MKILLILGILLGLIVTKRNAQDLENVKAVDDYSRPPEAKIFDTKLSTIVKLTNDMRKSVEIATTLMKQLNHAVSRVIIIIIQSQFQNHIIHQ